MSSISSSSSPLQSSTTVEELIAALQQIIAKNDVSDRSQENVSIILTSRIQLIFDNRTNQALLQALGEFFLWMMPYTESLKDAEREAEDEQQERGKKICSTKDFEDLILRHLLPYAKSSDAVYSLCRSVCRVSTTEDNTYFVTVDARDELLKSVKNAPCEKSLRWALQAISNLADTKKDGVSSNNPFVCDEVSTVAYKLFCESTVPKIVELASDVLIIQVVNSTPKFITADPEFALTFLRKLDEATETGPMSSIANLIVGILHKERSTYPQFASSEAAHVFLSKLNSSEDPETLRIVCLCINNVGTTFDDMSDEFASPEMCRAIFKCFSKEEDEITKDSVLRPVAALTRTLPRARTSFAQECPGLTQVLIDMVSTASEDETRLLIGAAVANISCHAESAKLLFNHGPLYEALIRAASHAKDEDTKQNIISAMGNATVACTDYLPVCAARYPLHDEKQIELFKLESFDSLVSNLEDSGWALVDATKAEFLKLQSISIVLEKFDQFLEVLDQRIEAGDDNVQHLLLAVAKGFTTMTRTYWAPLVGEPFFDATLALIERSSGAANVVFVNVIYNIVLSNPLFKIYPSTVLRLLQKLDDNKELRDREDAGLKMEFSIYKIQEEGAIRNPELFRDNDFLVDNSALIRSCFERSFEIHVNDPYYHENSLLNNHVEALYKADPRMKEKMEGWNGSTKAPTSAARSTSDVESAASVEEAPPPKKEETKKKEKTKYKLWQ